jgi:hypothetical protein
MSAGPVGRSLVGPLYGYNACVYRCGPAKLTSRQTNLNGLTESSRVPFHLAQDTYLTYCTVFSSHVTIVIQQTSVTVTQYKHG